MKIAIEQVEFFESLDDIVKAVPLCLEVERCSPDRAPMIAYQPQTGTLYINKQLMSGIEREKLIPVQNPSGETVLYRLSDLSQPIKILEREGLLEMPITPNSSKRYG